MRSHFQAAGAAQAEWINLVDEHGLLMEDRAQSVVLAKFLERGVDEVLIEARRNEGDQLPVDKVLPWLRGHVCHSNIRIANREFTVFAEVAINGVGRSWHAPQ